MADGDGGAESAPGTANGSARLSESNFAGLLGQYLRDEAVLWSGDGDLSTQGAVGDGFTKCAFVLTPARLWTFRGAGWLGAKKPLSVYLRDIEKVGRLPDFGLGKSQLGVNFSLGAKMMKGGPDRCTVSLIGSWRLQFASDALRDSCGLAIAAQIKGVFAEAG